MPTSCITDDECSWKDVVGEPPEEGMVFRLHIPTDRPDHNGNQFSQAAVRKALSEARARCDKGTLFVHTHGLAGNLPRLDTVVAKVNNIFYDWNDKTHVAVEFLSTDAGKIIEELVKHGARIAFKCQGVGRVNRNGQVMDYEVDYITADLNPARFEPDTYAAAVPPPPLALVLLGIVV